MNLFAINREEIVRTRSLGLKHKSVAEEDPLAMEVQLLLTDDVKTKCGEIFVSKTTNFTLICSTCKNEFNTMKSFGIHWQKENNCVEDNSEDLKLTPKVELEDEAICLSATFVEVKSEVIDEPQSPKTEVQAAADESDDADNYNLNESIELLEVEPLTIEPQDKNNSLQREKVRRIEKKTLRSKPVKAYNCDESEPEDSNDDSWHKEDYEKPTVMTKSRPRRTDVINDNDGDDKNKTRRGRPRQPKSEIDVCCRICDRRFSDLRSYQQHTHKVPDNLKCKYCDQVFANSSEYFDHIKTAHQGKRKFQCPHCPKTYRTRPVREEHLRIHTGERPFKCTTCPKTFVSKYALQGHIRLHLNQTDYACEFCDKRYLIRATLVNHRRSHTGERPFQCEQCGKSFSTNGILKNHRKRHAVKNFACDICGVAFHIQAELKGHYVKHTGARPFKCEICGNTFPRKGALRLHMDLHSSVNKYVCDLCGKSFKQNVGLYTHRKSH